MAAVPHAPAEARDPRGWIALGMAGLLLAAFGAGGVLSAAWGYALFAASLALVLASLGLLARLVLTRAGRGEALAAGARALALGAIAAYVLGVFALGGHFAYETIAGRMEWYWVLFGPAALAALVVLDWGLYRKLVANNLPTWRRFRAYIRREDADPAAMRRTLVDDVLVQRSLWRTSRLRWTRHALIFWGFAAMFGLELAAVLLREAVPAFGWRDIWREPGHPVRLAFDFGFDLTGLMVLAGCILALYWRVRVNATPERKFADTPTAVFLLAVVLSGFVVEGLRIAPAIGDPAHAGSFVGLAFAAATNALGVPAEAYRPAWLLHAFAALAFIAYVPLKRMVHTCATPMGRLMHSQQGLLAAKKRGVIAAMMRARGGLPAAARQDPFPPR